MTKMHRMEKQKKRYRYAALVVGVVLFLAIAFVGSMRLKLKRASYQAREDELAARIEEQMQRAEDIEELEKYMDTNSYVEEIAKERLGLVYQDEILFKADR